ncbi:KH domain-containing protein [Lactobacillus sp. S2-2]|uniref:RNA-binding cell elongation regulator Jag/EloR n=1 Tax=Lactobacillus sp. S2-2 TaxID=2692917 RepID=UPI001F2A075C|nr:RNA-binding cell elongation regulator Jag/EloR [Lactobacillus sp. S2-2]MCF6515399.1 KH domain-containing protein [Lactobacillus sp. S2-2]
MTIFKSTSIEEATKQGIETLGLSRENVEINIVQNPTKGFLGLFKKPAIVEIIKKEQHNEKKVTEVNEKLIKSNRDKKEESVSDLVEYLESIIQELGINAKSEVKFINNKHVYINFRADKEGLLIGKHGRTINSLQDLSLIYLNNLGINHLNIELDTANYRSKRKDVLENLARKTARNVMATGKPIYLDPMPSFERKIIHSALENSEYVMTYSTGLEQRRSIIIAPK